MTLRVRDEGVVRPFQALAFWCAGNEAEEQILAVASLDNLGKGASGAVVQCINLKTGVDETTGLAVAA
jgi:N-acetyl-gamma-glutamylphosphate reductase